MAETEFPWRDKSDSWPQAVFDALWNLGGAAHLEAIKSEIVRSNLRSKRGSKWEFHVHKTLGDFSSDTTRAQRVQPGSHRDVFANDTQGDGYWRIRDLSRWSGHVVRTRAEVTANIEPSLRLSLGDLRTIRAEHVIAAMKLCDTRGRDQFVAEYGFGRSQRYEVWHRGKTYDPKAIVGVAYRYAVPGSEPDRNSFVGGEAVTGKLLRDLGFDHLPIGVRPDDVAPTADDEEFRQRLHIALSLELDEPPPGHVEPKRVERRSTRYERDPLVSGHVIRQAGGVCEGCDSPAPFVNRLGDPFLEGHHVLPLSQGGPDTTSNVAALCPNCHRRCHHGRDRREFTATLYNRVSRLREPDSEQ